MSSRFFNWLNAKRVAVLLFTAVLAGGCATQPDQIVWQTGGAISQELSLTASVQYAQASSGNDSDSLYPGIDDDYDENDPLEIPNRFIFAFNQTLDVFVLKPAASSYRFLLPSVIRDAIRNFLRNLATPVVLINDLLQGEFERAETTLARFAINTSGGLGLYDFATGEGYEYHKEDMGQTFGSYGIGEGAYLVLPLFGPSSIRDGIGRIGDIFLDPLTYVGQIYDVETELLAIPLVNGIDIRSRNIETLEDLEADSIDFYARIRSLWRQNRQNEIDNGRNEKPTVTPGLSNFDFEIEPKDG